MHLQTNDKNLHRSVKPARTLKCATYRGQDSGVHHVQGVGYRSVLYPVCKAQKGATYRMQSSNVHCVQGAGFRNSQSTGCKAQEFSVFKVQRQGLHASQARGEDRGAAAEKQLQLTEAVQSRL